MIYQFEHREIKGCMGCPLSQASPSALKVKWSCLLNHKEIDIPKDILPDCPLVVISKMETIDADANLTHETSTEV